MPYPSPWYQFQQHFKSSFCADTRASINQYKKSVRQTFVWKSYTQNVDEIDSWGQFHQRSTRSFYICKLCVELFCAHILGLYFTGARLLAHKLHLERWWNWLLVSLTSPPAIKIGKSLSWKDRERKNFFQIGVLNIFSNAIPAK